MSVNLTTMNNDTTTTFVVSVGDVIKICRPSGYPPWNLASPPSEVVKDKTEMVGFKILDTDLGEFVRGNEVATNSACVYYQHNKSGKQVIEYTSRGAIINTKFYIVVQGIDIHDHASIHTGGPAFATYYAEVPQEES